MAAGQTVMSRMAPCMPLPPHVYSDYSRILKRFAADAFDME